MPILDVMRGRMFHVQLVLVSRLGEVAEAPVWHELARLMSDISESRWCEGWSHDLEHTLWRELMLCGDARLEDYHLKLVKLAVACGGWVVWDDGERYMPLPEWEVFHAAWVKRQTSLAEWP